MELITLSNTVIDLLDSYNKSNNKKESIQLRSEIMERLKDLNMELLHEDIIKVTNTLTYK